MDDTWHMLRALELAARGQGHVEPNPMVGCVVVRDGQVVGEGWHRRYGGPHAEVEALRVAGPLARGATLYVTLEPCCHEGKTPPCTAAIVRAGVARVVAAMRDPFPQVAGEGLAQLEAAGVATQLGTLADDAGQLLAPYLKLVTQGRPWVLGKWAMTLDGKLATRAGDSRWVSGEAARGVVHALRGRMDAVLVGRGTALADDPLLTARPPGPRTAVRIVADSQAALPLGSQLVRTARAAPVIVAAAEHAPADRCQALEAAGCEVLRLAGTTAGERLLNLLDELGRRRMTNVLVEGGGQLLGTLLDHRLVDEVHVFIAPKLVGGGAAPSPVAGQGIDRMEQALLLREMQHEVLGQDVYICGRLPSENRKAPPR